MSSPMPELIKLNAAQAAERGYGSMTIGILTGEHLEVIGALDQRVLGHYALPPGSIFVADYTLPYGQLYGFSVPDPTNGYKRFAVVGTELGLLTWGLFLADQRAAARADARRIVRTGMADIIEWLHSCGRTEV